MKHTIRTRVGGALLSFAMVLSLLPASALAVEDITSNGLSEAGNGSSSTTLKNLNDVNSWITDRQEPNNFTIEGGKITFSVKEQQQQNDWYDWQGRKAYTGAQVSSYWKVSYTMDVTESMLEQNNVNASLWIQVDEAGENGAASQQDCVDWAIIQFINTDTIKWQSWDAYGSGSWKDISDITTTAGTYTIDVEFANGYLTQYINGVQINAYDIGVSETAPVAVITQGKSFGDAFDVAMSVPTITTQAPEVVNIQTVDQLAAAIKKQQDGQTWNIAAGTYTLTRTQLDMYKDWKNPFTSFQSGWYFPLYADDLTINGIGDVIITSDVETANGAWATQDFVSVWGNGITIDNVDILSKDYQNKVIEIMGQNFTLRNAEMKKVNEWGSGSITFNSQINNGDIGTATIENVKLYAWISTNYSKTGTLNASDVTIDFTDNEYAGYTDSEHPEWGYGWCPGIFNNSSNVAVNNDNLTIIVDDGIALADQVLNSKIQPNTTVVLNSGTYELEENQCIVLNKKVTIQGSGTETVIAGFSSVDYGNGMFTFAGGSEGSVLKDLTISYQATGAQTSAVYFNGTFTGGNADNVTKIQNVVFNGGNTLETIGREMAITSTYHKTSPIGYLEVSGCTFNNFMYGMYFNRMSNAVIENCQFNGTKYNAINIAADGTAQNSGSDNIVIRNNVFQNISFANYEYNEYSSGIRLGVNTSNVTLLNNTMDMLNSKLPVYVDEGNTQTVAIVKDGDAVVAQYLVSANCTITLPAAPSKAGYSFNGWSDGSKSYAANAQVTISKDTTFTALWSYIPTGGGSSSGSGNQTETEKNPDGSTTTTVTKPDGSTTETTKYPDGSSEVVETKKDGTTTTTTTDTEGNKTEVIENTDGSSKTTVDNKDGSSSTTTVSKNGQVEAEVKLPAAVVNEAADKGEAVALPMPEVPVTSDRDEAATVTVTLPSSTSAKVEIPVENVTSGTVAVLVKADGTEEIIKTTLTTENGVAVTLADGDTVKIVDNSKDFDDVSNQYWGASYIDFATSRNLFSGTSATTFAPETVMTRSMIVTVLASYDGANTAASDGEAWYAAGQQWAMENGISDGTNMDGNLNREQLALMLWNYAGKPAPTGNLNSFVDAGNASDWAAQAMAWAVENGLISGMGNNALDPQGLATRAQVATIMSQFVALTA